MLRDHPLRGAIFESFVVAELIKAYSNRGLDAPLYHWRDSSGLEIDVLLELADGPLPIEVKSGMTVPPQAVASLLRWSALSGREEPRGVLVHGGTESFTLRGCRVLPWTLS